MKGGWNEVNNSPIYLRQKFGLELIGYCADTGRKRHHRYSRSTCTWDEVLLSTNNTLPGIGSCISISWQVQSIDSACNFLNWVEIFKQITFWIMHLIRWYQEERAHESDSEIPETINQKDTMDILLPVRFSVTRARMELSCISLSFSATFRGRIRSSLIIWLSSQDRIRLNF